MARPLPPPLLLVAPPLVDELFFAASLSLSMHIEFQNNKNLISIKSLDKS